MRVISGRFKGRQLVQFKATHIRPTTDRVKETIFNILQFDIEGADVLDLFSGTGNLAIESLSRGAVRVVAVEHNKDSLKVIRANLDVLAIANQIQVVAKDVFQYLAKYNGPSFDIVFIDPPFTESWADRCMSAIAQSNVGHANSLVVIESHKKEVLQDHYGEFVLLDRRDFGDKKASIYKKVSSNAQGSLPR